MAGPLPPVLVYLAAIVGVLGCVTILIALRALTNSVSHIVPKWRPKQTPTHLLVVLGSGGHTAEMFSMLRRMKLDPSQYTHRTYVVSSGDYFSAITAAGFEKELSQKASNNLAESYTVVTIPRARRVHQSFLTAPFSVLQCFWACLLVLRGCHPGQKPLPAPMASPYPDVILANGPATGVCVILAARLLRLYHCVVAFFLHRNNLCVAGRDSGAGERVLIRSDFQLRTIFVESWARVTSLSLSGKLLLPFADRFLVQWPALGGKRAWKGTKQTEYVGALVE